MAWPELEGVNCCQKTWGDGPYGREKMFLWARTTATAMVSTAATARMLEAVMTGVVDRVAAGPSACGVCSIVPLDPQQRKADPENQVDGFLGEGSARGCRFWSKAGLDESGLEGGIRTLDRSCLL